MTNEMNFDERLAIALALNNELIAAAALIESLTTNPTPSTDPYRPDTKFDDALTAMRDLLCDDDEMPDDLELLDAATFDALRDALALLKSHLDNSFARETLTTLALDQSLCPMHFTDYAICFDDRDDECAAIRLIHPSHDT